jgi:hypothetical protein
VSPKGGYKNENQGIGLYTREQEKNTTPFQYFAQVVGGAVVLLCGVLLLVVILDHRSRETAQFGSPEPHLYGFVVAGATITVGIFMAYAGVIIGDADFASTEKSAPSMTRCRANECNGLVTSIIETSQRQRLAVV